LKAAIRDNDPVILWNQNKCMVKGEVQMASILNGVADIKREGTMLQSCLWKIIKEAHKAAEN
jgi:pyruvate/2-oxoglutarate/acetoin dehydrogenase E1 component